jgi:hypothetical protein
MLDPPLCFPDPMVLRPIDARTWELASDYVVPAFGFSMRIPALFRFDMASVPHPVWTLIGATDLGRAAPLAHDWLYQHGGMCSGLVEPFRRVRADRLFRVLMQMEQVIGWRRWVAWAAVRLAGWACWRKAPVRLDEMNTHRHS